MTHDHLIERAERFLRNLNCKVVFNDKFRAYTSTGEQPDCIGFRDGLSFLVECKVSRSDFLADKKKRFRKDPNAGMGDWRFYLCPPGIIQPDDLPEGWGLLWCHPRKIERVHGIPSNTQYHLKKPFNANRDCEMQMMVSALRRMEIRGHLKEIYDGLPIKASAA